MAADPYLPPRDHDAPVATTARSRDDRNLSVIARDSLLAWEKLRIVYIGVLAVVTIMAMVLNGAPSAEQALLTIECAIVANLAYFAGPIVDTYIRWLGYRRAWPRWAMFVGGTILSILLAVAVLSGELLPDQQ